MNTSFGSRVLIAAWLAMVASTSSCYGALVLAGSNHSEDFNFLASTGADNGWTQDKAGPESTSGSPGWWWFGENISGYNANSGTVGTPEDRMSYGDDPDRALGSLTGGFNDYTVWSLVIQNNTSVPLTAISVSFTGEKWRDGDVNANTITFSYKTSTLASDFDSTADFGTVGAPEPVPSSWTARPGLNFTGTDVLPGDQPVDGNDPANQFTRSDTWAVNVPVGAYIALRWHDGNFGGSDHGLSIDNLMITAIPEPSAFLFGGVICGVVGMGLACRRLFRSPVAVKIAA
jgi:hypothetical protein